MVSVWVCVEKKRKERKVVVVVVGDPEVMVVGEVPSRGYWGSRQEGLVRSRGTLHTRSNLTTGTSYIYTSFHHNRERFVCAKEFIK